MEKKLLWVCVSLDRKTKLLLKEMAENKSMAVNAYIKKLLMEHLFPPQNSMDLKKIRHYQEITGKIKSF